MLTISFSPVSRNAKTGPIPVSGSRESTCPSVCPFKAHGCYASYGPIAWQWAKLNNSKVGMKWKEFIKAIRFLPRHTLWRHNQFGDLAGRGNKVDEKRLIELIDANRNRKGFTYTHKPVLKRQSKLAEKNANAIAEANKKGFTINLSGNNPSHADELKELNIGPVVCIVPKDSPNTFYTPKGNKGIVCPAQYKEGVTCASCRLCSVVNRSIIIGFKAHGVGAKYVEEQI